MTQKNRIPYGGEAFPGRFTCADCGYEIFFPHGRPLPPCPRFDDSHEKKSWKPHAGTRESAFSPEEKYPVHKRKEMAIALAMRIIADMIAAGASIQVESLQPSRDPVTIRWQLESFSSGAFVQGVSAAGVTEYFDIMYKSQWPVSVVEYSDGLRQTVEDCIRDMAAGEARDNREVLTAANSFIEPVLPHKRPPERRRLG